MMKHIGEQVGNYRLISLLGQGGVADVYLGEHIHLQTPAAIKLLQTRLVKDEIQHFLTEARIIADLSHPHIVRLLDFGIEDDIPFLIMEHAAGGTLRERCPAGKYMPLETLQPHIKQIAAALQYAHEHKLIHRDVKPENILLDARNEAMLSDFGIAVTAQSSRYNQTHDFAGTFAYMAPEQIQGKPCQASDQYALGIVVYEMLCGNRPFHGSFAELCSQHLLAQPPSLRKTIPSLSLRLERVVLKALAKDPQQRFASIQTFATALEEADSVLHPPSRRTFLLGSLGLALTGGAIAWFVLSSHLPAQSQISSGNTTTPTVNEQKSPISSATSSEDTTPSTSASPTPQDTTAANSTPSSGNTPADQPTQAPSTDPTLYIYRGQTGSVTTVAWSPGGSRIVSAGGDLTAQIWNARDGSDVITYTGHTKSIMVAAWSPDGNLIASGGWDGTVQVWNASNGAHILTYSGHTDAIFSLAWSPDGSRIVSGSYDSSAQVWNASTGNRFFIYTGHNAPIASVAWSPDGSRIVSGGYDNTARIWSASNGGPILTYTDHSGIIWSVKWSPDGNTIASGSVDTTVQVWNANNKSHLSTYTGHTNTVRSVSWSPDGSRIVSSGLDNTAQTWSASNGSHVFTYTHQAIIWSVAWSPGGNQIALGSDDHVAWVSQLL